MIKLSAIGLGMATTISCGTSKTLTIGVRVAEASLWQPIVDRFVKEAGIKVNMRLVSNMKDEYLSGTQLSQYRMLRLLMIVPKKGDK